jgi:DNA-nicking Smr family endonuclease
MSGQADNKKRSALKGLHSLSSVQRELALARRLAAERAERAAAEARLRQHEQQLFERSVGPVTPMRTPARVDHDLPRPQPVPLQFELDERRALQQALSDDVDIDTLLETDDTLSFRRPEVSAEVVKKLRRGHWALQGQIDLHGLRRDAAREALGQFVHDAARRGMRCIRVVHGKGNGSPGREPILKSRVRRWLVQKQEVLAFVQARASDGGSGALMVLLMGMPAA